MMLTLCEAFCWEFVVVFKAAVFELKDELALSLDGFGFGEAVLGKTQQFFISFGYAEPLVLELLFPVGFKSTLGCPSCLVNLLSSFFFHSRPYPVSLECGGVSYIE